MRKLQQFFILKINSSRLKESNYKIKKLTLQDARLNGESISLSDSQMLRTLRKLTNKKFSQYELDKLLEEKKQISHKKNSAGYREKITRVHEQIDNLLYIPELISIFFEDKRHFYNILDKGGFWVNGVRYIPFMASAGMIRRDTYLFIDEKYKLEITEVFNNSRSQNVEIVPAKFAAYYSLYSSTTLDVTFPKIAIVPDMLIKTFRKVDYAQYVGAGIDPVVSEREMELECNAFDGQGLCSPALARKWARDLELDYTPSVIGVRAPFLKGMMVVFDFHKFGKEIANQRTIVDIYGNTIDISKIECIVSESMFKLWSSYSSTFEYTTACSMNELDWGITKVNSKVEKNHARTSYQFLQVLNLSDADIDRLIEPTIDWLKNVSGGTIESSLLYSLGETDFSDGWFNRLDKPLQALLLNNDLLKDSFFISYLDKSISKKKNDAKIGRLIFNGNYQVMISDPYAMAAHIFGLGLKPLLNEFQHYSNYWNNRNVSQVASIRSPIVHSSEVNVLNFRNDDKTDTWFNHIQSGIVFPANGVGMDSALHGGSDFDLDLVCTLDSPEIVKGRTVGLPIVYETKKANKIKIDGDADRAVINSQVVQIKTNKIGFYTNVSSSQYTLLSQFEAGSPEHTALLQRLKYGRVLQGLAIDSAKGILTDPFPDHFVKWKKLDKDADELARFNNSIVANKRPYFMRWLYTHYNRRYGKELSKYNNVSQTKWGMSLAELAQQPILNDEQKQLLLDYKNKSFFLDNNSVMNRITKRIEQKLKETSEFRRNASRNFDHSILLSKDFRKPSRNNIDKMKLLFREYKNLKRGLQEHDEATLKLFDNLASINVYINHKAYSAISSNQTELANLAVYVCYVVLGKTSKAYCWQVFGTEIVNGILERYSEKFVRVPKPSLTGKINYLWDRYGMYLLNIEVLHATNV